MPSQDKLIKQGIRYTDNWFKRFKNRVHKDLSLCTRYDEFLERTKDYTTQNIMVNTGYSTVMEDIIIQSMQDKRFQRAAQRELVEQTIKYNVGNLITNVGEDIKTTVREVVSRGYDDGLHPREIAKNLDKEIDTINNTRARTIARTEVKRTDTIANYIQAVDEGATGFTVSCRPDCCEYCAEEYAGIENYDSSDKGQYGEAVGGNIEFGINEVVELPPLHPNCRCTVNYTYPRTTYNVRVERGESK